jgi:hypothetical protein
MAIIFGLYEKNTDSFENIFEKNLKIEIRVENYEL